MSSTGVINKRNGRKKGGKKKPTYSDVLRGIFPWKGDSISEKIRKSIFIIAIIIFAASAYYVFDYFWTNYTGQKLNQQIGNLYNDANSGYIETTDANVTEYYSILPGAQKLLDINPDTVGYIEIPDTIISYAVVQRRNEDDGNTYYLTHDFNGNESEMGAIFLDYRNYFDRADNEGVINTPNSQNLIIYGHHMKDSQMFGNLKDYKENYYYYDSHPLIYLNSNYKQYTYKIFGIFIVDAEDTDWQYYNHLNFDNEQDFYDYANQIKRRTIINTNVDVKYGDQLLLLSTCDTELDNSRLVIASRLVRVGEDPMEGTQDSSSNPNPLMPDDWYQWAGGSYDENAEFVPYG